MLTRHVAPLSRIRARRGASPFLGVALALSVGVLTSTVWGVDAATAAPRKARPHQAAHRHPAPVAPTRTPVRIEPDQSSMQGITVAAMGPAVFPRPTFGLDLWGGWSWMYGQGDVVGTRTTTTTTTTTPTGANSTTTTSGSTTTTTSGGTTTTTGHPATTTTTGTTTAINPSDTRNTPQTHGTASGLAYGLRATWWVTDRFGLELGYATVNESTTVAASDNPAGNSTGIGVPATGSAMPFAQTTSTTTTPGTVTGGTASTGPNGATNTQTTNAAVTTQTFGTVPSFGFPAGGSAVTYTVTTGANVPVQIFGPGTTTTQGTTTTTNTAFQTYPMSYLAVTGSAVAGLGGGLAGISYDPTVALNPINASTGAGAPPGNPTSSSLGAYLRGGNAGGTVPSGAGTATFMNLSMQTMPAMAAGTPTQNGTLNMVADAKVYGTSTVTTTLNVFDYLARFVAAQDAATEWTVAAGVVAPNLYEQDTTRLSLASAANSANPATQNTTFTAPPPSQSNQGTYVTSVKETATVTASETHVVAVNSNLVGPMVGIGARHLITPALMVYGQLNYAPVVVGTANAGSSTTAAGSLAVANTTTTSTFTSVPGGGGTTTVTDTSTTTNTTTNRTTNQGTTNDGPLASRPQSGSVAEAALGVRYGLTPNVALFAEAREQAFGNAGLVPTAQVTFTHLRAGLGLEF